MPHIHDKIDFTVEALIVHDNKVLLRKHDKYGIWLSVGGHIELHEDPIEALHREIKEEVGLTIELLTQTKNDQSGEYTELPPPQFLNRHKISDTHEHISLTYVVRALSSDIQQGDSELSDGIHWFSMDDLDDPTFGVSERIKSYAKEALQLAN